MFGVVHCLYFIKFCRRAISTKFKPSAGLLFNEVENVNYNGRIGRRKRTAKNSKHKLDLRSTSLWFSGILISLIPIGYEAIKFLALNKPLNFDFLYLICSEGDFLWVFASLAVTTALDFYSDPNCMVYGRLKKICALLCIVTGAIGFLLWSFIDAYYPEATNKNVPVVITLTIFFLALMLSSPIQIKSQPIGD